MKENTPEVTYFSGLDLGQAQEFSALAILEREMVPCEDNPRETISQYSVRHLIRFPLGTPFAEIADKLKEIYSRGPLKNSQLVVDQTSVGKPVFRMLHKAKVGARLVSLAISAGHNTVREGGTLFVPKKDLVGTMQLLLQSRRLLVAPTLLDAQLLLEELTNFKAKVTAVTPDSFESWREMPHDDLVLAVAIAAWRGERCLPLPGGLPLVVKTWERPEITSRGNRSF